MSAKVDDPIRELKQNECVKLLVPSHDVDDPIRELKPAMISLAEILNVDDPIRELKLSIRFDGSFVEKRRRSHKGIETRETTIACALSSRRSHKGIETINRQFCRTFNCHIDDPIRELKQVP